MSETITTTSTREFSFPGNSVLVQIMRNSIRLYALIAFDYWESDYKILYGTVPDFVVIEKDRQSSSLKITNNHQNSITVLIV